MKKSPYVKLTFGLLGFLIFIVLLVCIIDIVKHRTRLEKAQFLNLGDSKDDVREILGNADVQWSSGTEMFLNVIENDTSIYGRNYDFSADAFYLEFPFFYPVRFRLSPYEDDIVIEFDENGTIISIKNVE